MARIDAVGALLRWLNAMEPPELAVLGCVDTPLPPIPASAIGVRLLGCVADVDVDLPAQLLACGVGRVEVLTCPEHADATPDRVSEWSRVLDGVAVAQPVRAGRRSRRHGAVFDLAHPMLPRRIALGLGVPLRIPFDPTMPAHDRALAALRVLADQNRARLPEASGTEGEPAATLLQASGCTACGVCVRACPHDALTLDVAEGVSTLTHRRDACHADNACVRLCPAQALSAVGVLTLLDVARQGTRDLAVVATTACRRCGAQHPASEGELCPPCEFRSRHAFGSGRPT